jgi:hypothetical protein
MSQPDSKDPKGKAIVITGACLILTIVGLALVSNRLLDMAGVADERGLSIDERKEKAHRNGADYNASSTTSLFNVAEWFSKRTADKMCGDGNITTTVARLIKENTADLGQLGILGAKLDAARVGGPDAVKKLDSIQVRENEIRIASEPLPAQYNKDLDRAICQLQYTVKGLGYSEIATMTATYALQKGKDDWVVTLVGLK